MRNIQSCDWAMLERLVAVETGVVYNGIERTSLSNRALATLRGIAREVLFVGPGSTLGFAEAFLGATHDELE